MPNTPIDLTPRDIHPWVAEGNRRVRFGISIFPQPLDWQHFFAIVQRAEADGMDGYWAYDHPQSRVDCWTSLSALATQTRTIRLGTAVDCIYYRSPYLLARQAADVDRLSNGRLILGLGSACGARVPQDGHPLPAHRHAPAGHGRDDHDPARPMVRAAVPFRRRAVVGGYGRHVSAAAPAAAGADHDCRRGREGDAAPGRAVCRRLQYGRARLDRRATTAEGIARKFAKLDEYLAGYGRPADSVLRSQFTMPLIMAETQAALEQKMAGMPQDVLEWCGDALFAGTPDETIAFYQDLVAAGFRYFIANILDGDHDTIELMGKHLIPAFA